MNRQEGSWLALLEHARTLDPDPELAHLSDDDLQRDVRDGASRLAAMECAWLLRVGELVVRGVWADEGARTPGQWLSFTCGMDGSTAREKCRVALALRELPQIRARFAAGTLSYSKVRAITRVATPQIEDRLLQLADSAPASHIVRLLAAGRRSADELLRWQDGPPTVRAGEVRDLQRYVLDDGAVEYRVRLPADEAMAVDERLDWLVDRADGDERGPATEVGAPSRGARRAAAIVDALAVAAATEAPDRSGRDDHLVVVHVAAEDLAEAVADAGASADAPARRPRRGYVTTGRGRGMLLPRRVLARLACDTTLRLAGTAADGHPADVGRRSRAVPADLRRALALRDRHCRFPGCHTNRGLHAHHVVHWARGGPTNLDNLVLLCGHHHRFASADAAAIGAGVDPPPLALQPPWWDGGPYDASETVRIISEMLLDVAA